MSSRNEIDQLQADAACYCDRVTLLRAKLYRWGLGMNARLQELERAEQRLREARVRAKP